MYTAAFGSSADIISASIVELPYAAGGFVWIGWDYLGEPTPYYLPRSSYFGIKDLAGFEKTGISIPVPLAIRSSKQSHSTALELAGTCR